MALQRCACIETMYTHLPFLQRFQAAKDDGFAAIEFWDWRPYTTEEIRQTAQEVGIPINGFDGDAHFSLVNPEERTQYLEHLQNSLNFAKAVGAKSITIHSNGLGKGGVVLSKFENLSHTVKLCSMYEGLRQSAILAEEAGVTLHLEALNITTDHVGNFLKTTQMGVELCQLINSPRLKLLYDVYHMQQNEGNIIPTLYRYGHLFGHVHIADVPGRHEPGTGELNYPVILDALEATGYTGLVGCELYPTTTARAVKAIFNSMT